MMVTNVRRFLIGLVETCLLLLLLAPVSACTVDDSSIERATTETVSKDAYTIPGGKVFLETVKRWNGTKSKELSYHADESPWVLNASYKVTSQLSNKFSVYVTESTDIPGIEHLLYTEVTQSGISYIMVEDTGEFKIIIESSGVEWSVIVGIE